MKKRFDFDMWLYNGGDFWLAIVSTIISASAIVVAAYTFLSSIGATCQ